MALIATSVGPRRGALSDARIFDKANEQHTLCRQHVRGCGGARHPSTIIRLLSGMIVAAEHPNTKGRRFTEGNSLRVACPSGMHQWLHVNERQPTEWRAIVQNYEVILTCVSFQVKRLTKLQ